MIWTGAKPPFYECLQWVEGGCRSAGQIQGRNLRRTALTRLRRVSAALDSSRSAFALHRASSRQSLGSFLQLPSDRPEILAKPAHCAAASEREAPRHERDSEYPANHKARSCNVCLREDAWQLLLQT